MNKEQIHERLVEIKNFLNKDWKSLSENFVERLCLRAEYDRLTRELYVNTRNNK